MAEITSAERFGINVIGFASGNLGLGHTTRQLIHVLRDRGVAFSVLDLDPGLGRGKFDNEFQSLCVESACDLPHPVNLFVTGASALADLALFPPRGLLVENRLNVAFAWWELPDMPAHWYAAGRSFDVLMAGSGFVQETFSRHIPGVPVLLSPHPIETPEYVQPDRARFGLPETAFLVCMGFEPHSDLTRKNPFAALDAFRTAYADRADCHLVIKINNPNTEGACRQQMDRLLQLVRGDPRIHLVEERLPYADLLVLYASCDAFISLHRSEGLGLVPLEAMRLGKPVVATGWSGNMSYMTPRNACLVSFDFRETDDSSWTYGPRALGIVSHWAEPDIAQAAAWLRRLADDSDFRAAIGRQAAIDAARYQACAKRAEFVDELRFILENRTLLSAVDRRSLLRSVRDGLEKDLRRQVGIFRWLGRSIKRELDRRLFWRFSKP